MENKSCGCNPDNGFICHLHINNYESAEDFELRKFLNSHLTESVINHIHITCASKQIDGAEMMMAISKIHKRFHIVDFGVYHTVWFKLKGIETRN